MWNLYFQKLNCVREKYANGNFVSGIVIKQLKYFG